VSQQPILRPYDAYRTTPEPWLQRIPAHWELVRLKHVLAERNERGHPDEPLLAATQAKGVVRKDEYGSRTVVATKDLHNLKLVHVGDFVISLRSFQGGIEYARHRGIISPAYTVLYPRNIACHAYLAALFKSRPFIGNLTLYVTGIRQGQNIDYAKLGRSLVPLPSDAEMASIARFVLDIEAKCSRFIRSKRRLIELVNEQKQAIVTRAVTKGLSTNATLRPTGIGWIGSIPRHWEVARLKQICRLESGHTPSRKVADYWVDCTVPWFTLADVHQVRGDKVERVRETSERVSELGLANSSARKLPKGTVFLSRTASVGFSGIMDCDMATSQDFACWIPGDRITSEYLLYVLRGMRSYRPRSPLIRRTRTPRRIPISRTPGSSTTRLSSGR
jgi:type I restriction enzyme, S subunit